MEAEEAAEVVAAEGVAAPVLARVAHVHAPVPAAEERAVL